MNFQKYIDESWSRHDNQIVKVVQSYDEGLKLAQTEADVLALARLISYISTDHDFQFDFAGQSLQKVKAQVV